MVTEQTVCVFGWSSWSGVLAGVVTAIALSIIMAILGVALGFTVVSPKSDDPMSGLGVAFGVWSFISVVVSMAGGGFVSGLFAGYRGMEHGFLVWALALIVATFFSSVAVGAAVRTIGSAVKSVGSGAAGVVSTVGKETVNMASNAVSGLLEKVNIDMDSDTLASDVSDVLRDTGIETLQPAYLQQQMREARADLRGALHQLSMNPSNYETIISQFLEKEEARVTALTKDINKEDAIQAVMRTRNVSRPEAETMVNNAIAAYDKVLDKAKTTLADAGDQVREAQQYMKDMADQARETADKWASEAAKAALAAAIALIVAAFISMGAGVYGVRYSAHWYAYNHTDINNSDLMR